MSLATVRSCTIAMLWATAAFAAPPNSETNAGRSDTPLATLGVQYLYLYGGGYPQKPPPPFETRKDQAQGLALDAAGNTYISGIATSRDFPTTASLGQSSGPNGCFVIKLDPAGKTLYSVRIPATDYSVCYVAVDASGNAYVTGGVSWGEFPTTPGAFQRSVRGEVDVFVAKLNPTGTAIVYSTLIGSPGYDIPAGIVVDSTGNAFITGMAAPGFPTANAFQAAHGGNVDSFVTKLNADGSALVYSSFLGGSGNDASHGLALSAAGELLIAGETESTDFPASPKPARATPAGDTDAFAAKIGSAGGLIYATVWGSDEIDRASAIASGPAGKTYLTGSSQGDALLVRLNVSGTVEESRRYGGSRDDSGRGIAVDNQGSVYVAGSTASDDFPTLNLVHVRNSPGLCADSNHSPLLPCSDTFVLKLDSAGEPVYSTYLTGAGNDAPGALALDAAGRIYISGVTQGAFPDQSLIVKPARIEPAPQVVTFTPSSAYVARLEEQRSAAVIDAVVSGASFLSGAAPGGIISIFGVGLVKGPGVVAADGPRLPSELAGTRVTINGVPAPLYAVARLEGWEQINAQVPFAVTPSVLNLEVTTNGVSTSAVRIPFGMTQAAVFTWQGGYAVAQHADYTLVTREHPVRPGEIIVLYGSGFGPVDPPVETGAPTPMSPLSRAVYPPEVSIAGEMLELHFAGLTPGSVGLCQLNARIPESAAPGDVTIVVGNQNVKLPVGASLLESP